MPNGQILRSSPELASSVDGVASRQLLLLDASHGAVDPGYWMPWAPYHKGSFEVTGTFSATVKLLTSNAAIQPPNTYQLTVGGTIHTGDIIKVNILCPDLLNGTIPVTYTVLSSDSSKTILTTSLMAAINAAIDVQRQYVADTQNVNIAAGLLDAIFQTDGSDGLINIQWQYPFPPLAVTTAVSGPSHTTTVTAAPFDDGEGFQVVNCSVTTPSNIPFDQCGTWIKAAITAWASDTGGITAIVQTSIP